MDAGTTLRLGDIMSTPVIALTPTATVDEAITLMLMRGYTTLPVVAEDGHLLGMVTEFEVGLARFGDGESGPVSTIMKRPPVAVSVGGELRAVAAAMADSRTRCLPVTDGARVVGMVSWRDLLRASNGGLRPPAGLSSS
ncbi:CBS domain-containing protein [Amycolatopsis sp. K13G38]|uniref:CBS domain-containing protein n=1 Tax=Amycolatopsis acididurans TaxID=2724524 RepID=A0ABX1JKD9_9PSEU|nr:CBS domain-containing protein [Amycolatopsis acididurans]NKQ59289.1 CBS domain-containing protein [Amycolatopsis acididurans]